MTQLGCTIVGGRGGASVTVPCWTPCSSGPGYDGMPVRTLGTSRVNNHTDYALAEVSGTPSIGSRVEFVYRGSEQPPLVGVLVFASSADLAPFAPVGRGLILPAINLVFGPYSFAPPLRIPLDVPSSAELGRLYFGQFLVLGSASPLASSPFTFSVVR